MRSLIVLIALCLIGSTAADAQLQRKPVNNPSVPVMDSIQPRLKVEIWSDMVCPFCYIGKRKFEQALEQFAHKDNVDIVWKSFQLSPELKTEPGKSVYQYLAEHKGMSIEQARQLSGNVARMAETVGLHYDFDNAKTANSFNAHRMSHFAKTSGLQDEAEEKIFEAYFINGKNIDDEQTLLEIGAQIGLDTATLKAALVNGDYAADVTEDIRQASQLGVSGVPFFVFNRRYAVSGAQDVSVFLNTLQKAYAEIGE